MKIIDEVWMLVSETDEELNVIYCIGSNPKEVWERVIDEELMGTGCTKEQLKKRGFRAKRVSLSVPSNSSLIPLDHMPNEVKHRLQVEQSDLFRGLWNSLCQEQKTLDEEFNVARNLACSNWTTDCVGITGPTSYDPNLMKKLNENYEMMREIISRKKYFLLKAFESYLKETFRINDIHHEIISYWNDELSKSNPELDDRFKEEKCPTKKHG